jgi:hypothetical protein
MKFRLIASILMLAVASWAQTATQSTPEKANPAPKETKASCPCCEKMSGMHHGDMSVGDHHEMSSDDHSSDDHAKVATDDHSCCHGMKEGKCDMAACKSKEGMACMKASDGKSASADDKGGCCSGAKGCCSKMAEKDKAAMKCCGDKCDRHEHARAGGTL